MPEAIGDIGRGENCVCAGTEGTDGTNGESVLHNGFIGTCGGNPENVVAFPDMDGGTGPCDWDARVSVPFTLNQIYRYYTAKTGRVYRYYSCLPSSYMIYLSIMSNNHEYTTKLTVLAARYPLVNLIVA